jgi:hypothetical protein
VKWRQVDWEISSGLPIAKEEQRTARSSGAQSQLPALKERQRAVGRLSGRPRISSEIFPQPPEEGALLCDPSLKDRLEVEEQLHMRKSRALIQWQSLLLKACTTASERTMLEYATRNDHPRRMWQERKSAMRQSEPVSGPRRLDFVA